MLQRRRKSSAPLQTRRISGGVLEGEAKTCHSGVPLCSSIDSRKCKDVFSFLCQIPNGRPPLLPHLRRQTQHRQSNSTARASAETWLQARSRAVVMVSGLKGSSPTKFCRVLHQHVCSECCVGSHNLFVTLRFTDSFCSVARWVPYVRKGNFRRHAVVWETSGVR